MQLLIPAWDLRHTPFQFSLSFDWRHPGVRRVLLLMLPVTISLGLINFNLLINSFFGSLVSDEAPAAIDKAFRLYQLPQGIFSVAIATVLFPTLARFANAGEIDNLRATMANGMRQILFVLVPAAAAILALSEPIIRLVYQRGDFQPAETAVVATALFWFAFSLPTNGLYLLQTRTFFSLQRPWQATGLAVIDLVVSALAALALYKPFGVGGIVAGTGIGTTAAVVAQAVILRREFDGLELGRLFSTTVRIIARLGGPGRASAGCVWDAARRGARPRPARSDRLARWRPRRSAAVTYFAIAKLLRIAELEQIMRLLRARARCSGRAATCWESSSSPSWSASPGWAASALRARLLPRLAGAPGSSRVDGSGPGAPDLGRGGARDRRRFQARPVSAVVLSPVSLRLAFADPGPSPAGGVGAGVPRGAEGAQRPSTVGDAATTGPAGQVLGPAIARLPRHRGRRHRPLRRRRASAARRPG